MFRLVLQTISGKKIVENLFGLFSPGSKFLGLSLDVTQFKSKICQGYHFTSQHFNEQTRSSLQLTRINNVV